MTRPIPHIGRTLAQIDRAAVRRRFERQLRQLHSEEEAAAFQPLPAQFVAANDDEPAESAAASRVPSWADLRAVFAGDMLRAALAIAGWIVAGILLAPFAAPLVRALQAALG